MATSSSSTTTSNAGPARSSRSTVVQDEPKAPIDELLLQELQAHRPYEALEDMILAIIDQTYAALIEFLGFDAPPEGGGLVKASQIVDPPPPYSTFSPMLLVVEASAMHCCVHFTEIDDALEAGDDDGSGKECRQSVSMRQLGPRANRRTRGISSTGMVHLARTDGGDDDEGWRKRAGDVRPDVSGKKGLVGVLDAMSSRMVTVMREGDRVIAAAKAAGCRSRIATSDICRVGMIVAKMRRQVDLDQVMRIRSMYRFQCRPCGTNVRRRRRQRLVDEAADVVAKRRWQQTADVMAERLKGLEV